MTDLPDGWEWTEIGEIAVISGGIQKQPKRAPVDNAYPFLRVANVLDSRLDLSDVHSVELFDGELQRLRLEVGDLLVVEGNGSASQIGRAALWSGEIEDCVHQNHLIRVRPSGVLPEFLSMLWRSPNLRSQLESVASSTSGLYTLSTKKIASLSVPLPPIAEQQRIVEALNDLFSGIDAALGIVEDCRRRAHSLRAAVLDEAFAGRLVSQEPDDIPASVLLEGARAARTVAPARDRRRSAALKVKR